MCIRDSDPCGPDRAECEGRADRGGGSGDGDDANQAPVPVPVSYTHLRAHETVLDLVCRLLLEKKTVPENKHNTRLNTTKEHL